MRRAGGPAIVAGLLLVAAHQGALAQEIGVPDLAVPDLGPAAPPTSLRAMDLRPLGRRTPVVFVHGHGMEGLAPPLYATWARFLQGRAASAGEDWWARFKPYLFQYDVSGPGQDYRAVGDAFGDALRAQPELFSEEGYLPAAPLVGVSFSAGALVWHQGMRALPASVQGHLYAVSPPTQGTVGATFLGPYALDRGGPEATAAFREEYARRFQEAVVRDFRTLYPEAYRARVRRELGAADAASAARALARRHWETLVRVHGEMAATTSAAAYRTLAIDNLGPGGGALIDPARLVAMGAVDAEGRPFVNHWLRDLHADADYSKVTIYMGRGNTDLRRRGLAGLLAGGGPGGAEHAECQRRVCQDVTRSPALPRGLADADPTVPRALGAGTFLPEGSRPRVVDVARMSHHQGALHPGVLLHIHDSMTRAGPPPAESSPAPASASAPAPAAADGAAVGMGLLGMGP